jgi:hypothetical protein
VYAQVARILWLLIKQQVAFKLDKIIPQARIITVMGTLDRGIVALSEQTVALSREPIFSRHALVTGNTTKHAVTNCKN